MMSQEDTIKGRLVAMVFEHSCKNSFIPVIKKVLHDDQLVSSLHKPLSELLEEIKLQPIYVLVVVFQKFLTSLQSFEAGINACSYSNNLRSILQLLEKTYEQCDCLSLKKYFSLITQLKFLDLMHLLKLDLEASVLLQRLNLHFPRWQANQKVHLQKQFSIENPVILDKVEESHTQCRRLMMKLAADSSYKSQYMSSQFSDDLITMKRESALYLKELISNLLSNAGETMIEKILHQQEAIDLDDLTHQLLLDYIKPEATSDSLIQFLDDMDSALSPPVGGFSSCLLPIMDVDCSDSESECYSDEDSEMEDEPECTNNEHS